MDPYNDPYGGGGGDLDPIVLVLVFLMLAVAMAIAVGIHYVLYRACSAIPAQHRTIEPPMVWLGLVPCVNIVWNFFLYPRLAASFRTHFLQTTGNDPTGSMEQVGIAYAVLAILSAIPYIGSCFGIVALVLIIVYLVKAWELKGQIERAATVGSSVPVTY